ncbi:MAG: hypothetical protein J1E42_00805, partial [Akkermansiaceae bacterium]|nr:hypothetical protein [Akkermansiaceae bacterium]
NAKNGDKRLTNNNKEERKGRGKSISPQEPKEKAGHTIKTDIAHQESCMTQYSATALSSATSYHRHSHA